MLKGFLQFFKKPALIDQAEKIATDMLNIAYDMFQYSMRVVIEKEKEKEDIYKLDRKLNELEIKVRRDIIEHLSINPTQDIIPSLILATIVIDIERIGDYSKNLIELSHKYPKPLKGEYIEKIKNLEGKVQYNFKKVIEACNKEDEELGKKVMDELTKVSKECQTLLESMVDDKSLSSKEGIIYALLLRYLKRVSAHSKNVASSVVNPFQRLGYRYISSANRRG
ncbi:MAG: PhoU domain-containing protein [candidate division WOR-3 bacterium]|nr:PhoU domain-containing protein [candidate division WOR-3 bacterium]